jgi:hypothetical protein
VRGLKDILIAVVDGKRFPEGRRCRTCSQSLLARRRFSGCGSGRAKPSPFPQTVLQPGIAHLIRHSLACPARIARRCCRASILRKVVQSAVVPGSIFMGKRATSGCRDQCNQPAGCETQCCEPTGDRRDAVAQGWPEKPTADHHCEPFRPSPRRRTFSCTRRRRVLRNTPSAIL